VKITIERDVFAEAVGWVLRCVGARATLPVLGGVLVEASGSEIRLAGTDLEIAGESKTTAAVEEPGRVVLPGRVLGEIARSLPEGTVRVDTDAGQGRITCGAAEFTLRTLPVEDFPNVSSPAQAPPGKIDAKLFAEAVGQVTKAASRDEARPILTGVLIEISKDSMTLVATDSYRLSVRELSWTGPGAELRRVVPARALTEGAKAVEGESEVTLAIGESQVGVTAGGRTLTTRLIEGEFPNWRQLLPKDQPGSLTIDRDAFAEAVRRVGILAQQGAPVRLDLSAGGVRLTAGTQDLGEAAEHVPGTFEGDPLAIAFNPAYLLDGIQAVASAELKLSVRDGLKPALLASATPDGFTYLLMPVRIS
jgi:DNA polymerase-3 subunit beta